MKKAASYAVIAFLAMLSALNYAIFVFPNRFAPAGIDGICTMIQDVLNINMGYLSLLVNVPLVVAAFIVLNREFALKTTVYILAFSAFTVFLGSLDMSGIAYFTSNGTSTVLAPFAAGTVRGILYVVTLELNGSSGGGDIISALIKYKKPHLDIMNIIFVFNIAVALCSYFVYGFSFEPVICSIIYSFISSAVCSKIRHAKKETVKFEVITQRSKELCDEITSRFKQKATIVDVHGAYSGRSGKMVICAVKKEIAPFIEDLLLSYNDSVVFKSVIDDSVLGIVYK